MEKCHHLLFSPAEDEFLLTSYDPIHDSIKVVNATHVVIGGKATRFTWESDPLMILGSPVDPVASSSRDTDYATLWGVNHSRLEYHESASELQVGWSIRNEGDVFLVQENEMVKSPENWKIIQVIDLGDNESFKKIMGYTDAIIVGHSKYPDHYHYTLDDLNDIEQKATKCNAEFLITTEKDLVKIFGEFTANRIVNFINLLKSYFKNSSRSLIISSRDYIVYEKKVLLCKDENQLLADEIQNYSHRVEHLFVRLNNLEKIVK